MTGAPHPDSIVVGVIDDGIAFAHERFRIGGESRVRHFWMQDGAFQGPGSGIDYGRAFAKRDIDGWIAACTRAGAVDEDEIYRRAGLVDHARRGHKAASWRVAHGTHVMDLACGYDSKEARADRPIVCVQLPARTTANTSGAGLAPYAIDALWYIRDRADEIAGYGQSLPIVINFSYGLIGGPLDGTSDLELAIDALIEERRRQGKPPLQVVLPAGNSHLSRCHAKLSFPAAPAPGVETLPWRVLPDDMTPSFMDIWLPPRGVGRESSARLVVSVQPPGGAEIGSLDDSAPALLKWQPNGKTLCSLQFNEAAGLTGRGRFRICIRPTASPGRPGPLAPAGTWLVKLQNAGLRPVEAVHAWIARDESLYGYPRRGRQSYFDHPKYVRFDHAGREKETDDPGCPVRRAGLINAIGTGRSAVVVGGFLRREAGAAKYTAGGPALPRSGENIANRDAPDAMAVSEDSGVHRGVLAAGSRSGSVVAMGGTSVAAPQITRWIADRLAERKLGNRDAVERLAKDREIMRPHDQPRPVKERAGGGRIELDPVVKLPRFETDKRREGA